MKENLHNVIARNEAIQKTNVMDCFGQALAMTTKNTDAVEIIKLITSSIKTAKKLTINH